MSTNPSPNISATLGSILREYPIEEAGSALYDHDVRDLLGAELPQQIESVIGEDHLEVHGSAGQGLWTSIPWVAVRDPEETESIQEGIYVVYLFEPQKERVFLTLNQGVSKVRSDRGMADAREVLQQRARDVREQIDPDGFTAGALEFEFASSRNQLYGPGTIFYKEYTLDDLPGPEQAKADLQVIVSSYSDLVSQQPRKDGGEAIEYDGITDATEQVTSKLDDYNRENFLDSELTESILEQWTDAMSNFGPNYEASSQDTFLYEQINGLFEHCEGRLQRSASDLNIGTVGSLSPAETLFTVLLRDLQASHGTRTNANHVKLGLIRSGRYSTEDDEEGTAGEEQDSQSHELFQYFENENEDISVWKFTSYGDDYPTIIKHGAIQFTESQLHDFEKLSTGDIVLFYAAQETKNDDIDSSGGGLVGGGIIAEKTTKNESWWWNEFTGNTDYRYIALFDDLYLTGDTAEIDQTRSIQEKDLATISKEIKAVKHNRIPISELHDLSQQHREKDFPAISVLTNLHVERPENHSFIEEVLDRLTARVTKITYDREDAATLQGAEKPLRADAIREQLTEKGQVVFHGPPGTGKTFTARRFARWWLNEQVDSPTQDQLRFITFHPSFNYEDFFEGLTAKEQESGAVTYEIKDGVFKEVCRDAERAYNDATDPSSAPPYVLVIDEINRGNLAKIFGESITQLEMDKRRGQDEEVTVELAHSGQEFTVPPNLYIIGTMNTADRSIALVDAALRRRFSFFSFQPNYDVLGEEYDITGGLSDSVSDSVTFNGLLKRSIAALQVINQNILSSRELSKGKQVGHSYLFGLETTQDVVNAWKYDILPLLEEYYFGELDRLQDTVFETDDCGLFNSSTQEINEDFQEETLSRELDTLLDRTSQSYTVPR